MSHSPDRHDQTAASGSGEGQSRGKPTINDVARLAKVSKKTVSRVINESPFVKQKTRDAIKAVIAELGFTPDPQARALARRKSFLIGLVYDNPSPQYVVNIQRGILDALEGTDFQLVLHPCDRTKPDHVARVRAFVQQHKPFGLILPPSVSEDELLARTLDEAEVDYVRIASVQLDSPSRMIRTLDGEGAAAAGRHLAELGHRQIAHIHGPLSFRSTHERRAGFERALHEAGLSLQPDMAVEGGYTFEGGVTAAEQLLNQPSPPQAIFAGNDEMATGAYVAVRRAGFRIPEDISIVGFDDTPIAGRLWPALTTVRLPIREMGSAAARLLLATANGAVARQLVTFEPEIVVRGSTATPHKA
ncbi:putative HTH-type transcriptional repressor ExuR [Candidatus Phycosocius bacilliformis]|uniref:Putative HTH-type transcriptional repressor ExuR n=1 Tax=Candidatus Phycosocius bacilliformis TaxID=1445552 RepID=A0A2P2EEH2_9PROT|nr:LacI family DNA-binding transcriptional regulator [Candidatus Phycosocius bacilliformis]GBF59459.1 putative HTH-type transcriptional repressor ExuR [Candidatus Phycosocius bacilliformis]